MRLVHEVSVCLTCSSYMGVLTVSVAGFDSKVSTLQVWGNLALRVETYQSRLL
jgi:hypothetical protein